MLNDLAPFATSATPLVVLPAPWRRTTLVNCPTLAARVLQDADSFGKTRKRRPVFGRGVLTSEGKAWSAQREVAQSFFHPSQLGRIVEPVDRFADDLVAEWAAGMHASVSITVDVGRLVARLACRMLFGVDIDERARIIGESLDKLLPPGTLRTALARRRARHALTKVIEFIIAAPREPDALLAKLRNAKATSPLLGEIPLSDEVSTYLLAGSETTATLIGWALTLLADAPEWQARARREGTPTIEAILNETLRLYPPVWRLTRRVNRAQTLEGVKLTRGSTIWILPYFIHRDARFWEDAENFRPDRPFVPRAFLPFGAGPRACPGRRLALTLSTRILARILERFSLAPNGARPEPAPLFTLRPARPISVNLTEAR